MDLGEGRVGKRKALHWPERRVTPGAGKKGCLPPSPCTHAGPAPGGGAVT